jgi:Mn2+/Fe2+ NRAMP family transporter
MVSGILAHPGWLDVLEHSVVPHIEGSQKYLALFVAAFGTTISPYLFVWQSGQEVDRWKEDRAEDHRSRAAAIDRALHRSKEDTIIGMTFSQLIGWFVMIAGGAVLFPAGHRDIQTANEAAQALAPLGHGLGTLLFSLGIIGTGLLAIPTLVGSTAFAVAGLACTPAGMREPASHSKVFSATIGAGVVVGAGIALSGAGLVGMLLGAAVINGALAAPLLIVVLLVANNRDIMGDRRNGWGLNLLVLAAAVIMGASSLWLGANWVGAHV